MKAEPKAYVPNQTAKNETGDFAQFTDFMRRLVAVPHSTIKARLEEEKRTKKKRVSVSPGPAV
jgi:hypothetical protein